MGMLERTASTLLLLLSTRCAAPPAPHPAHPTPEELAESNRLRAENDARVAADQAEVDERAAFQARNDAHNEAADAEKKRLKEENDAAWAAWRARKQAAVDAEKPELERDAKIFAWASDNCDLRFPPHTFVTHCDPVCWREELSPCPELKCRAKPPESDWVVIATTQACADHRGMSNVRARAVSP